jgi:hypothetical protein
MNNSTIKKLVMVSSRFGGKEENIKRAEAFCRYVVSVGHIPIAPHVFFPRFLDDLKEEERQLGLEGSLKLMERCDEIWFFVEDGETLSPGMLMEAELMVRLEMPYKVINADMALEALEEEELHESYSNYDVDLSFTPRFTDNDLGFHFFKFDHVNPKASNPSMPGASCRQQFDEQDWHLIYKNNHDE